MATPPLDPVPLPPEAVAAILIRFDSQLPQNSPFFPFT